MVFRCVLSHASVPPEQKKILGITDSLIRLSVGIEDADDLINDLKQALEIIKKWYISCKKFFPNAVVLLGLQFLYSNTINRFERNINRK